MTDKAVALLQFCIRHALTVTEFQCISPISVTFLTKQITCHCFFFQYT